MTELFTLIALWCGMPTAGGSYGLITGKESINDCRAELLKCTKQSDGFYYKYDPQCFVKQKLK